MGRKIPRKSASRTGRGSRLSDVAYTRILEALFDRRLPAGSFVSQAELVKLSGVPVAPLRDALRVLEAEGLVAIHPRAGIQFVKPGLELTRSTYQFRGIVESAAVAVFAETASEAELEAIECQHKEALATLEENGLTPEILVELNLLEQILHNAIIASLGNALIESSYRRIHNYLALVRLDRKLTVPLAARSIREHLAIIAACRKRSATEATAALQAHFAAALQRHMGLY